MPLIRGGGNARSGGVRQEEPAAITGGGDPISAGLGRPARVSAATALASFNWTDDAIVEVTGATFEENDQMCERSLRSPAGR